MSPTAYGLAVPGEAGASRDAIRRETAPPSTLAAQLVQNLRSSAKSSRSDEISEIKSFVPIIEKVKNRPELLQTLEQRIEHNHMLIYVVRVVLEGEKWDDPFADWKSLHRETLKVINCIKVTIDETPLVLTYAAPAGTFVSRGSEDLWLWLFPKLLRILGHPKCEPLTAAIQDLFQSILSFACSSGVMWEWAQVFVRYLREIYDVLISQVNTKLRTAKGVKDAIQIDLPPRSVLSSILDLESDSVPNVFYSVKTVTQAMGQAHTILEVLFHPVKAKARQARPVPFVWDTLFWVLEAIPAYQSVQELVGNPLRSDTVFAGKLLIELMAIFERDPLTDQEILEKGYRQMTLSCATLCKTLSSTSWDCGEETDAAYVVAKTLLTLVEPARKLGGENLRLLFRDLILPILDPVEGSGLGSKLGKDVEVRAWRLDCITAL